MNEDEGDIVNKLISRFDYIKNFEMVDLSTGK